MRSKHTLGFVQPVLSVIPHIPHIFVSALSGPSTCLYKPALVVAAVLLGAAGSFYENDSVQTAFAQQSQYDLNFRADVNGSTVTFNWNDITLSGAVITNYHLTTDGRGASYQFGTNDGISHTAILGTHPFLTPRGSTFEPGDTVTYNLEAYDYDRRAPYGGGLLVASDTITITLPTNNPPVANAGAHQTVISNAKDIVLDGSASTDIDGDVLSYRWTSLNGTSISDDRDVKPSVGIPNVREGSSTYAFELKVSDGLSSSTDTTYITVQNSAPVANAGRDFAATAGTTTRLNAYGSYDYDGSGLVYTWTQVSGIDVTLNNNGVQRPSFTAPDSPTLLTFRVTVSDGDLTDTDTVSVRVVTTNPPVVNTSASKKYASVGQLVILNGTLSSDSDGDQLRYHWEYLSGLAVTIRDSNSEVAYFTAPSVTGYVMIRLTVSDDVFSVSEKLSISIGTNRSPDASISGEITQPSHYLSQPVTNVVADYYLPNGGVTFTLDGSNSFDHDGDALKYQWEQTDGPTVAITGVRSAMASFNTNSLPNDATVLTFSLTVRDILGNTGTEFVTIYVDGISRPTADAGSGIEASPGDRISFDGTGSVSPINSGLTYSWTQINGTTATLSNANRANPSITVPEITGSTDTLVYELTVRDMNSQTDTDRVSVLVTEKVRPIANAGPNQNVDSDDPVTLNASGSMTQITGDVTYLWSQTTGTNVVLSDTAVASPTFTAPTTSYAVLTFTLTLSDSDNYSDSDTVVITVGSNTPPVADAGDDINVMSNSAIRLSGSATDLDNDRLTYAWTKISGTDVTFWNTDTARPTFMAPDAGSVEMLVFQMTVTDAFGNTDTDTVTVTVHPLVVTPPPTAVVADAGITQRVDTGSSVTLDGSGSTGSNLTYSWTHTSGPSITFSDSAVASPTFTAPSSAGAIVLSLTVSSGNDTDSDTVNIEVVSTNDPPIANAGSNQEVRVGSSVTLSGSASDPDSDALTYLWTQTSGTTVSISDHNRASATFTAPSTTGSLVFKLVVSDALVQLYPYLIITEHLLHLQHHLQQAHLYSNL